MPMLHHFMRFAVALLVGAFVPCALAALPAGVTQGPTVEGITEYRLANGLTVLLFPDATKATTTVNVTYRVGSLHENYGETGMAHLLEHMLFKGTPTRGNILEELGRRGMQANGTTSWDRTNYFESFNASPENLDWALQMEADRMVNSKVARSDLDTEMTVVRNEMENGENNPTLVLYGRMLAAAYHWHNYGKLQIGARADVENVNIERLQAFYRLYYQPDNAVLIVAGKFDPDATLAAIAKYFGPIPKPARTLPPLYTVDPVQDGERSVTVRRVGNSKLVGMMFHTVRGAAPDYVASDVLGDVMTVAPSGRLYKALVDTKKASGVEAWGQALQDPGTLTFIAQVPESQLTEPARAAMLETLENIRAQPITEEEVARIRLQAAKSFDATINNPQRLAVALSEAIALGDWRLFYLQRDRYRQVTAADVQRVALDYLKRSNLTVGEFIPEAAPDRAATPAAVDVAAQVKDYKGEATVAAGEAFDATPANLDARAQRFALGNGMKVVLLPKKTRGETVNFALTLNFADEQSATGKRAVGDMTAALLPHGTTGRDRQQIADTLDRLRAKTTFGGSATGASVSGQTYRPQLADTLRLVAEILRTPTFPATELEKAKLETTTALEESRSDPESVAIRALARQNNPYPAGHPRYAPTLDESLAATKAVTRDALVAFHRQFYGANNAELAIVGDFDPVAVRALVTELFGDWSSAAPSARVPNPLRPNKPAALQFELADKANAFLIGKMAIPVNDMSPDYPALLVANFILGESSSSRLLSRLRQKDGLSYGAGGYFEPSQYEANSALGLYAIFAPENLARVRAGFAEELARANKDGFTDAEVADAKKGVLEQRRLTRTSDSALAGGLANQAHLGRTFARSAEVDAAIATLTTAQVNDVLRKYLKPEEFAYSYAGDFGKAKK